MQELKTDSVFINLWFVGNSKLNLEFYIYISQRGGQEELLRRAKIHSNSHSVSYFIGL